jgi:hypothetical protein
VLRHSNAVDINCYNRDVSVRNLSFVRKDGFVNSARCLRPLTNFYHAVTVAIYVAFSNCRPDLGAECCRLLIMMNIREIFRAAKYDRIRQASTPKCRRSTPDT